MRRDGITPDQQQEDERLERRIGANERKGVLDPTTSHEYPNDARRRLKFYTRKKGGGKGHGRGTRTSVLDGLEGHEDRRRGGRRQGVKKGVKKKGHDSRRTTISRMTPKSFFFYTTPKKKATTKLFQLFCRGARDVDDVWGFKQ